MYTYVYMRLHAYMLSYIEKLAVYSNLFHLHLATIKQFLQDVCWSNIDYLIIDTPPGTSDEHISVIEQLRQYKPDGAILVTTPQVRTTLHCSSISANCFK